MKTDLGFGIDSYPLRDARIIQLNGYPAEGPCSLCGSNWDGKLNIFDGLFIGEFGYKATVNSDGTLNTRVTHNVHSDLNKLHHFRAYMSPIKIFWSSVLMRYLFRPTLWFSESIKHISKDHLYVYSCPHLKHDEESPCEAKPAASLQAPYISLHVRYGDKGYIILYCIAFNYIILHYICLLYTSDAADE